MTEKPAFSEKKILKNKKQSASLQGKAASNSILSRQLYNSANCSPKKKSSTGHFKKTF